MPQKPRVQVDRQFIETCLELDLLHDRDATSLSKVIGEENGAVVQTALQRGLLTPADVDIVQSLQHPTEIVPGYRILELIGRGAMGVVYRAEQLDLEKMVALKTILISNVSDPTVAARFEREAKSVARLQHPNIVQALNFGKYEGRYYFAMEYVPGRTCEQAIVDGRVMPAAEAWPIVRQVASGLMHALDQNLLHRDIKPANIILLPAQKGAVNQAEVVKIADFGLAMFADQSSEQLKLTTGDKIMGSPAYMSLEQFGDRQVDFRSDMYSLGATAWHLLFGKPPFQGGSVAAIFRQKSEPFVVDPSALPVMLPDDQMRLLMRLLDPNPDQRPPSYEQLIDAIDALGVCDSMAPGISSFASQRLATNTFSKSEQPTQESPLVSSDGTAVAPLVNAMAATTELSRSSIQPSIQARSTRLKWLVAVAMLAITASVIGIVKSRSATRGPRTHTRVVGNTPLFDGKTLSGWDVGGSMVGAWNTVLAPDSSTAIACITRQGALTRRFSGTPYARISLFVWLQKDSGPVDIDFALDPADPLDTRGCLRLTGTASQLGEKKSDFDDLDVTFQSDALPTVYDRYHVVHIERQRTDWYVFLEEKLVGTLPIDRIGDGNALRLVVHGSEGGIETRGETDDAERTSAFFADVELYQLREEVDRSVAP